METDEFNRLYEAYGRMLYRIAFVMTANAADAEELVQEAFLRLFSHSPVFESPEHEKAWLIRVTTNLCKNHLASAWKRRVEPAEQMELFGVEEPQRELLLLVLNLAPKYKEVVLLYYYQGYSVQQIASILKVGESAVKMRLQRARRQLKLDYDGEKEGSKR